MTEPSRQRSRFSIVIPVKNDAKRLAVCLESIQRLDYPKDRIEVIVVDNGSTDDSVAIARHHGAQVLIHPELKVGALRNRGVEVSTGELIAFVDSDHEVPANWLEEAERQFRADADLCILGSAYLAPAHGTWVQRAWEQHRLRDRSRHEIAWLASGNMFIRRADFTACQGFDETLVAAEDVDLCHRVARLGKKIVSDMAVANVHHGEPRTLSAFFWKEYWRGSSGVRAFLRQGMPLRDLPSLVWPVYHLVLAIATVVALVSALWISGAWFWGALILWMLPAFLLACKTSFGHQKPSLIPALWVLYFTYGMSRAAALFKR